MAKVKSFTDRLNAYRIMWVLVMYDLPTDTKADKKRYSVFRKRLLKNGFVLFQFSKYLRHCSSQEQANTYIAYVESIVPEKGKVGILCITDKQFGNMKIFFGGKPEEVPLGTQQLELF